MKQILQSFRTGETELREIPIPLVGRGTLLIRTTHSLVSLGTERMLVEFGQANLIEKARQQPDRVKMVLDKMKTDGIVPTLEAVFNKLNQPLPLGYCNVGVIKEMGKAVVGFKIGDRVASNGNHAEFVSVPENLVTKIPENVSNEEATFTVIGSIALQGIRLINPTLGETYVVVGLGLVGQITVQLLKAHGCRVIGYDFDQYKVDLAKSFGIAAFNPTNGIDPASFVLEITNGIGTDGVLITASAKGDEIVHQSAQMCRKHGRIILVGVVNLNINRADFYEKELTFQVSCSYGPGRYDENYEQKGQDYPIGYVRWTEKRNFEAVLQTISSGQLNVKPLITEQVPLESYMEIYGDMRKAGSIASILIYPENPSQTKVVKVFDKITSSTKGLIGIIGAGNFTCSTVLPGLKRAGANIKYIASSGGQTAVILAKKHKIALATTDYQEILNDPNIDLVMITTRHNLHASMTQEALAAGKHVFVEKPLCLNNEELNQIINIYEKSDKMVVVGFNRRFSPLAIKLKGILGDGPKNIIATMNAGYIPQKHWVHDLEVGGGRIIGEACHYIDLCTYLAGSPIISVCMNAMGTSTDTATDNAFILLKYDNGTNAVINYIANGCKKYPKERIEIHSGQRTLVLDNWRELRGYGIKGFSKLKIRQDKGHAIQFKLLNETLIKGGKSIIPFADIINTTKASFAAIQSLKENRWVDIT